jgi:hypothetical protein
MKKTLFLILVILLLSKFYCQVDYTESDCEKKEGAKKKKDCNGLGVSKNAYKCCYVKIEGSLKGESLDYEGCMEIDKESYDKINDLIEEREKEIKDEGGKYDIKKYDCNSNYLLISIMSLILLLFL